MEFAGAPYFMAAIFMALAITVFLLRISRKDGAAVAAQPELSHQVP
ncbi:Uncharacterised protein [Mycobacterium tuberculosis]|nr:Uncharacterised protein [Mycobacterium tuberculosis]